MHTANPSRILALDGLRGIAVGLVLQEHIIGRFHVGWLGVDLFFALSGFLITTILLGEKNERHFWRMFYVRRATRILPAFFVLLILCTQFWHVNWLRAGPYVFLSLSNVAFLTIPSIMYPSGFEILWSLCVEEHFYLLWPLQVRRFPRRVLVCLLIALVVLEPILRAILLHFIRSRDWIYFQTPFRLDSIALGSLLALGVSHAKTREILSRFVPPACVIWAVVMLILHPAYNTLSNLLYTLYAITGSLAVAYAVLRPNGWVGRILSFGPLVFVGQISYSLYLYHQTVLHMISRLYPRVGQIPYLSVPLLKVAALVLSIVVAWVSFRFLETPVLRWGREKAHSYKEDSLVAAQAS